MKKVTKKADKTELSYLTIELKEIEDHEKGRGCNCHVSGQSSVIAAAKMFRVMFEVLEKEHPEAFIPAMVSFMMEDMDEGMFGDLLKGHF